MLRGVLLVPFVLALVVRPCGAVDCSEVLIDPATGDPTRVDVRIDSPAPGSIVKSFEPGCGVEVTGVASAIGIPAQIDFYLVLDVSGSTREPSGIGTQSIAQAEYAAARAFIESIDLTFSSVAIVMFDSDARVVAQLGWNRTALLHALDAPPTDGGTDYSVALDAVRAEHAARAAPRREQVVLFMTDGQPNAGTLPPGAVACTTWSTPECAGIRWAEEMHREGLVLHAFGLGLGPGMGVLRAMASATNGTARRLTTAGDIVELLPSVAHVGLSAVSVADDSGLEHPASVTPDGHFRARVPLVAGANELRVIARPLPPTVGHAECATVVMATCVSVSCPATRTVDCAGDGIADVGGWTATRTDPDVVAANDSPFASAHGADASGRYPVGTTRVSWTFGVGAETMTCSSEVVVQEGDPPKLAMPWSERRVSCTDALPDGEPRILPGCDPDPVLSSTDRREPGPCPQSFDVVRTWTVRDRWGRGQVAEQRMHVADDVAPVFDAPPADERASCDRVPPAPALRATDDCDPAPSVRLDERIVPGECAGRWEIVRAWTAADACGNAASVTQRVRVSDDAAPILSGVPGDGRASCDAVPEAARVVAIDACDPAPVVAFEERRIDGDCPGRWTLRRTWTATDACGNSSSATQAIAVMDETPPVVTPSLAEIARLWPPRHDLVPVPLSAFPQAASESCSLPLTWRLVACTSDQPDDGRGDGATPGDCVIAADGSRALVRSERSGLGKDGRRYVVRAVAIDACGNVSEPASVGTVFVPHDLR